MGNRRTYQFGCSQLTIEFGSITTSTAQVLVSSDDYYLSMGGGVSASILRAGGPSIALDASKRVPAMLGDVVVTTAGSLPAQYIFHAITIGPNESGMSHQEIVRSCTHKCLQILDALQLNSIAFPAIGAGVALFSYDEVAVEMAEVISKNLQQRKSPVYATIYLFDRFGTMTELDFIRFFEEFALRVPRIAEHVIPDQPAEVRITQTMDAAQTEEQVRMQRITNLRRLISALEEKRFELEEKLIESIDGDQDDTKAKLRHKLDENQELRLKLLAELQGFSHKATDTSSKGVEMPKDTQVPVADTYVDFDLHIAPDGHAVASSSEGQATCEIATDPPNDIHLALELIQRRQANQMLLKQVGQSLYNWLFPGPVHTHLQQTEAAARSSNAKLRLRLHIEPSTVSCLPLEFLYRALGGYYLAVNPSTVLSRYLNLPLPPERVRRRNGALHLLAIISDPIDLVRLSPDEWEAIIRDAMSAPLTDGRLTLQVVKQATRRQIRDALLRQRPDIVQYIGHGAYRNDVGYITLVDDKTGTAVLVDDERFANLFMGYEDNLGLISLLACESGQSADPQNFIGIAPKLVQRGAPAVVAMQYEITISSAKVFLDDFYAAVAARKPIDWAVQSARNAVSQEFGFDNREFATPVLYMRASDGLVF